MLLAQFFAHRQFRLCLAVTIADCAVGKAGSTPSGKRVLGGDSDNLIRPLLEIEVQFDLGVMKVDVAVPQNTARKVGRTITQRTITQRTIARAP